MNFSLLLHNTLLTSLMVLNIMIATSATAISQRFDKCCLIESENRRCISWYTGKIVQSFQQKTYCFLYLYFILFILGFFEWHQQMLFLIVNFGKVNVDYPVLCSEEECFLTFFSVYYIEMADTVCIYRTHTYLDMGYRLLF